MCELSYQCLGGEQKREFRKEYDIEVCLLQDKTYIEPWRLLAFKLDKM